METENAHSEFILSQVDFIKKSEQAYQTLSSYGWFGLMQQMMSDPVTAENLMLAYDMQWKEHDQPYKHAFYVWKEILDKNSKKAPDTSEEIAQIAKSHIERMEKIRPLSEAEMAELNKMYELKTESIDLNKSYYSSSDNVSSDIAMAAEPYEDTYGQQEEWKSIKSAAFTPEENVPVIIAGYYYPGLVVYKIGHYTSDGWEIRDVAQGTQYTPLYWKHIGPAPKNFMKAF